MGDNYFKNKYKIDSTRLKYWDYGNPGYYFVTICVKGKVCSFGKIKNGIMCLSDVGSVTHNYWLDILQHFPFVELHDFVVMPNHVHGVIFIGDDNNSDNCDIVETRHGASPYNVPNHTKIKYDNNNTNNGGGKIVGVKLETINTQVGGKPETRHGASLQANQNEFGPLQKKSLQLVLNQYKGAVKRWCNKNNRVYFIWQPRFHDHLIRNEYEMNRIQEYIKNNPSNWEKDIFYF